VKQIRFRIFGFTIWSIEIVDYVVESEDVESDCGMLGGSTHNFDRDVNPISPEDRYNWEWEDKRKGFGFR
jgi:hypothetical protein